MMELWGAYYEVGTLAGCELIRGENIPEGLHHAVTEIFVLHCDETFFAGAIRELREETRIITTELNKIYTVITSDIFYKGYICIVNIDKDSIML